MTLGQIAQVVDGTVVGTDPDPDTVTVTSPAFLDSRNSEAGGLFVALTGERVDGHDFVGNAVASGAAAYLGSRDCGVPGVLVEDPVAALGALARHLIESLPNLTVLALTGSQGKTGTKDYLGHVLAGVGETVATYGNLNNELGVPMTVLRAGPSTSYLVVEMGARGIGHIAELCRIAPPAVAGVLNVGTAHIGEFGGQEQIAAAKGEILEALAPTGTAVLNADDRLTAAMGDRTPARVLMFGPAGHADVTWDDVRSDDLGRPSFELGYDGRVARVSLRQIGAHQVLNAAAAAAMALAVGVPWETVAHRLASAEATSRWRMEPHVRGDGLLVINDAYNANPESMAAAVGTLAEIGRGRRGRSIAVLGEMLELGVDSVSGHRAVGQAVATARIDVLVTVGAAAQAIAEGASSDLKWRGEVVVTPTRDAALAWVGDNVSAADVVLVKASRGAALEHIADGLLVEGDAAR